MVKGRRSSLAPCACASSTVLGTSMTSKRTGRSCCLRTRGLTGAVLSRSSAQTAASSSSLVFRQDLVTSLIVDGLRYSLLCAICGWSIRSGGCSGSIVLTTAADSVNVLAEFTAPQQARLSIIHGSIDAVGGLQAACAMLQSSLAKAEQRLVDARAYAESNIKPTQVIIVRITN